MRACAQCVCVCSVCGVCMVMQSAQQQVKRRGKEKREERREKRGGWQPINQQKQKNKRERAKREKRAQKNRKTEKQRCDCSVCRSVGGIQLATQRCFCRQRSYQRDHARSRLVLIAEAKPVWARSVLPWVTRWESRVMLLSLFLLQQPSSLFSLSFSSFVLHTHIHTRTLLHLVGSFGWLFPSLPPHTHTRSPFFLGCAPPPPACTGVLSATHTHTHTHTEGWLVGEHTGTQTAHHGDDGMRCHT